MFWPLFFWPRPLYLLLYQYKRQSFLPRLKKKKDPVNFSFKLIGPRHSAIETDSGVPRIFFPLSVLYHLRRQFFKNSKKYELPLIQKDSYLLVSQHHEEHFKCQKNEHIKIKLHGWTFSFMLSCSGRECSSLHVISYQQIFICYSMLL
jgi:hypothetical protein